MSTRNVPVFGWEKLLRATVRMWSTAGGGSARSAWTLTQRIEKASLSVLQRVVVGSVEEVEV
jgi:hypothetical protein